MSRLQSGARSRSRLSYYQSTASNAPSRLARRETTAANERSTRWRLRWQIVAIWLAIAASGLLYLIVVFPLLVDWTGQLNASKYVAPANTIRPQMPLLNAPPSYTNDPNLKISGFATPDTKVQFILDGQEESDYLLTVGLNGEFSLVIPLEEGEHTLQAYSYDDQGLESNLTKKYTVTLDTHKPEIDLQAPENGLELVGREAQTIVVHGQTEPGVKVVVNSVGGRSDSEGIFDISYRLQEGSNVLEVTATDDAGNEAHVTIAVSYMP